MMATVVIKELVVFKKVIEVPDEELEPYDSIYDWFVDRSEEVDERTIMTWDDAVEIEREVKRLE